MLEGIYMYLSNFETDKKYLFRELSIYAAKADDVFQDEEKLIIDAHCLEMRIDNNGYENELKYEDVLEKIVETFTPTELGMVYLEILSVLLADDHISEMEQVFIEDISRYFGMNEQEIKNAEEALLLLKRAYSMMADFIVGK